MDHSDRKGIYMILCTLFDSNYLDKGMALYESLENVSQEFKLYIFAFDNLAKEILDSLHYKNAIVIGYDSIENNDLKEIKKERSKAEFCWTCSSVIIEYVLDVYKEKSCTYIDADMYFYGNPDVLYREIMDAGCSVGISPHRFKKGATYRENIRRSGKYCVQFNTFINNKDGRQVLNEWKKQCLDWCYRRIENGKYGDQKYLDNWLQKYNCVHELEHLGSGVAPWNIENYKKIMKKKKNVFLLDENGKRSQLIFFHFEALKYLETNYIYLNLWEYMDLYIFFNPFNKKRRQIVRYIYLPYLKHIDSIREFLKKEYHLSFDHMTVNREKSKYYLPEIRNTIEWLRKRWNVIRWKII